VPRSSARRLIVEDILTSPCTPATTSATPR
jgi:hypothetical protein